MPLEALLIPVNLTNSDYDGINGGTGCNFFFFHCEMKKRTYKGYLVLNRLQITL